MVVTDRSPTSIARTIQEAIGVPSSHTVHAEQAPRSQPIFVPVKSSGPRNASASVMCGGTAMVRTAPLIRSGSGTASGPIIAASAFFSARAVDAARLVWSMTPPAVAPAPVRNDRRETSSSLRGAVNFCAGCFIRSRLRPRASKLSDLKLIIERACVKRFDRNQKQRSPAETALRVLPGPAQRIAALQLFL